MTTQIEKNEKAEVTEYFNGTGFDRWNRIYSESDDVNKVQKNIRIGHQKTVDDVISWLKEYENIKDKNTKILKDKETESVDPINSENEIIELIEN